MTDKQRIDCIRKMDSYTDRDAYVSDLALSRLWGNAEDTGGTPGRAEELYALWDAWHSNISDIAAAAGTSYRKLAERFGIPYRTMEDWCAARRKPPQYILVMMLEILAKSKN